MKAWGLALVLAGCATARPGSPEACVQDYWRHLDADDPAGAANFLAEPFRGIFLRSSTAFHAHEAARRHLARAATARYGARAGSYFETPWESDHRARPLRIHEVRLDGDTAWIAAHVVTRSRVVATEELFALRRVDGKWLVGDDAGGARLGQDGGAAEERKTIVQAAAARDYEALAREVERGALTLDEAAARATAIGQAEIDDDAVAGDLMPNLERAGRGELQWLTLLPPHDNALLLASNASQLAESIDRLARALDGKKFAVAAARVRSALGPPRRLLPRFRAKLIKVEGQHATVELEWLEPPGGTTRYDARADHHVWKLAPPPDDAVFANWRKPRLLELLEAWRSAMYALSELEHNLGASVYEDELKVLERIDRIAERLRAAEH